MIYRRLTYRFKNAIEVEEHRNINYGAPGRGRQKRDKPTKEQMEKVNQYNREKRARHRLREYFDVNDYFSDLTYRREARPPDMKTAKKQFKKFLKAVRKEYAKRGKPLRWMRNIEVGTKNGWHIHFIVNRIEDTDIILRKAWEYGKVVNVLLYEKGEFTKLAAYITKTPKTDPRLKESSYSSSRNMPLKKPEKKDYRYWKSWRKIKIPEGFYLEKETFYEGENPHTGFKYRRYTLLRYRRI